MNIFILAIVLLLQSPATSIQGIVVKSGSGEPLSKAVVEARAEQSGGGEPLTVTTSDDGKFIFRNLKPGQYRLTALRAGYASNEYQQTIALTRGQNAEVRFAMTQTASIDGRVFDRKGQPVVGATVRAMKPAWSDGRRTLRTVQSAITNDLGEYRIFWLPPGAYFISALPIRSESYGGNMLYSGSNRGPELNGLGVGSIGGRQGPELTGYLAELYQATRKTGESYIPTYYPGTLDEDRATAVRLAPGANTGGVDLVVAPVATHRVRGRMINGVSKAPMYAQLRKARASSVDECAKQVMLDREDCSWEPVDPDDGTFDLRSVLPGSYVLYALTNNMSARVAVDVGDADIDNLPIVLYSGVTVRGRIVPGAKDVKVRLTPGSPVREKDFAADSAADGSFSLQDVTLGDYSAAITGIHGGYLKSIRFGNSDVFANGLHLTGDAKDSLEVVLGDNPGKIDGRVLNADGSPVVHATVTLTPVGAGQRRADLYKTIETGASGRFELQDIAPGDYNLLAWEEIENEAWRDPSLIREFENRGKPIHVTEGSSQALDLTVIPARTF